MEERRLRREGGILVGGDGYENGSSIGKNVRRREEERDERDKSARSIGQAKCGIFFTGMRSCVDKIMLW